MNFMPTKRSPLGHVEHFELILHISAWSSTCGQNVHWPTGTMPCRMWGLHATRTKRPIVPYSLKHSAHLFRTMSKLNSHEQSKFLNKWLSFRGLFTDRAVEIGPRPWYLEGNLKHRSPKGGGAKKTQMQVWILLILAARNRRRLVSNGFQTA